MGDTLHITVRPRVQLSITVTPPIQLTLQRNGSTLGLPGLSAYEVWLAQPGNAGKTVEEYLASLVGPAGPAFVLLEGDKYSSVDAGTWGQVSLADDYVYYCVKTGTAGNAIWKKVIMFQT